jgi:multidrug transporter EmrE-like cation transporter
VGGFCILASTNYYLETMTVYGAISVLSPLAYAITDVVRRLVVIVASVLIFQNTITALNAFGVLLALAGVLAYNVVTSTASSSPPSSSSSSSSAAAANTNGASSTGAHVHAGMHIAMGVMPHTSSTASPSSGTAPLSSAAHAPALHLSPGLHAHRPSLLGLTTSPSR